MKNEVFNNDYMDGMRQVGDAEVDPLVAKVIGAGTKSRLGYNHMVDLADRFVATPSLK